MNRSGDKRRQAGLPGQSPRGIAIFVIMTVIVFLLLLFFILYKFTSQAAYGVHRFYYKSTCTQLANSILDESENWLDRQMDDHSSELYQTITGSLREVVTELRDGDEEVEDGPVYDLTDQFQAAIPNCRSLAQFCEILDEDDIAITLSFKNIKNFVTTPEPSALQTRGYIHPDPVECYGNMLIEIAVDTGNVTVKHRIWRNFKFVNILPPVITKFSLFVKEQDRPSQVNNMKMNQVFPYFAKGFAEAGATKVRPVVVINSLTDYDRVGMRPGGAGGIRQMRSADSPDHDVRRKGWVFLGADLAQTNGFILNLTAGVLYNLNHGLMWKEEFLQNVNLSNFFDAGRLYYGEYFHRPITQSFFFSTRDYGSGAGDRAPTYLMDLAPDDADYRTVLDDNLQRMADENLNLRYVAIVQNFMSFTRTMADRNVDPFFLWAFGGPNLNKNFILMFKNYFDQNLGDLVQYRYRFEGEDPRSEHPSLLHLFGEDYIADRLYYESRSPTLVLGPVKRRFLLLGCLRQEGTRDHQAPGYLHRIPWDPKQMKLLWLPFYNFESDGSYDSGKNSTYVDLKWQSDWARISERFPGEYEHGTWGARFATGLGGPHFLMDGLSDDSEYCLNRQIYRDMLMSRVIEDNYLFSFDTMCQDGQPESKLTSDQVLRLENVPSLDWPDSSDTGDDEGFFYDYAGPCHRGIVRLNGVAEDESGDDAADGGAGDDDRVLFEGNIRSLDVFSDDFTIDENQRMVCSRYDHRLKATRVVKRSVFISEYLREAGDAYLLKLDDIIYVKPDDETDSANLVIDRPLKVAGRGAIIYDHAIILNGNVTMEDGEDFNSSAAGRNLNDENTPLGTIRIPPLVICSTGSYIKIANASRVDAYLVALHPQKGTVRAENLQREFILVGGLAVHHFELDFNKRKVHYSGLGIEAEYITTGRPDNVFARVGHNRFRVVYNDNVEPTYNENWDKHYVFKMGPVVYERD